MARNRSCDARCHEAKHAACSCWCGGLFHGEAGAASREAFRKVFGEKIPAHDPNDTQKVSLFQDPQFERWNLAIRRACDARRAVSQ